jgi:phenylpyruvate tautomerase PptA (4-oxalocrotonate tautomerase family)
MPNVTIEVRRQYRSAEEEAIIAAVHAALMEGIKTPEWDRTIRVVTHEPHRFAVPPGRTDRYTLVEIDLFSGRSIEAKRSMFEGGLILT